MEKINTILTFALIFATCVANCATTDSTPASEKTGLKIVYQEPFVEAGILFSYFKDDKPDLYMLPTPYLHFNLNNYISERLFYSYFLTPVAIYSMRNENGSYKVRFFQVEAGVSGSFSPVRDFWVTAGAGFAYRFLKQNSPASADPWENLSNYDKYHLFGAVSLSYWATTNAGFRLTFNAGKDYFAIHGGLVVSLSTITSKIFNRK